MQKNKILIRDDRYGYAGLSFVSLPILQTDLIFLPYKPVSYALYRWKEMMEHSCNAVFFYFIEKFYDLPYGIKKVFCAGCARRSSIKQDFFHQKITGNVPVLGQLSVVFILLKMNVIWIL